MSDIRPFPFFVVPKSIAEFHSELRLGAYFVPGLAVKQAGIPSQSHGLARKAAIRQEMKSKMRADRQGQCDQPLWLLTMPACQSGRGGDGVNTRFDCIHVLKVLGCMAKLLTHRCTRASISFHSCPHYLLPFKIFFASSSEENVIFF